jgi:hypothetical protein
LYASSPPCGLGALLLPPWAFLSPADIVFFNNFHTPQKSSSEKVITCTHGRIFDVSKEAKITKVMLSALASLMCT